MNDTRKCSTRAKWERVGDLVSLPLHYPRATRLPVYRRPPEGRQPLLRHEEACLRSIYRRSDDALALELPPGCTKRSGEASSNVLFEIGLSQPVGLFPIWFPIQVGRTKKQVIGPPPRISLDRGYDRCSTAVQP